MGKLIFINEEGKTEVIHSKFEKDDLEYIKNQLEYLRYFKEEQRIIDILEDRYIDEN